MHCYNKSIKDLLEETPEPKMRKVEEGLFPSRELTKEELEIVKEWVRSTSTKLEQGYNLLKDE